LTSIDAKDESTRAAEANRALVDIGRVLSLEPQLGVAFDRIVAIIKTIVPTDRIVITSFDRDGRLLVDEHVSGIGIPGRTPEDIVGRGSP
jgi:hypothetical protein